MSRKFCRRRVYTLAKGLTPLAVAKYNACKLTEEEWNEQYLPVTVTVDELMRGEWDFSENWSPMLECLRRIKTMLALKKMPDHGLVAEAEVAFATALNRQKATGARAFKADELRILREVAKVYGDLLREITHGEFAQACRKTKDHFTRLNRQKAKSA